MQTYPKVQTLFKRDMDGSRTGKKGKMMPGEWTTPELEYLAGNEWEFTEKVDGTNIRVFFTRFTNSSQVDAWVYGRSDNASIPNPLMDYLNKTFLQSPFLANERVTDWMIDNNLDSVYLFGEGYGPKIQGGGKYLDGHSFVLFDVKIGDWWLKRDDVDDIAARLGIDSVPVIGHGSLYQAINYVKFGNPYLDEELARIESYDSTALDRMRGPMRSMWGDFEAEGIVARPMVPLFDRKGERIITKIKAVDFK